MKYVIINHSIPIVFSDANQHIKFKNIGNITSAGFCKFIKLPNNLYRGVETFGESKSLDMKPDEYDFAILERLFGRV